MKKTKVRLPIIILLMLFPAIFSVQAANLINYSQIDLSQAINENNTKGFSASSQPLSSEGSPHNFPKA